MAFRDSRVNKRGKIAQENKKEGGLTRMEKKE